MGCLMLPFESSEFLFCRRFILSAHLPMHGSPHPSTLPQYLAQLWKDLLEQRQSRALQHKRKSQCPEQTEKMTAKCVDRRRGILCSFDPGLQRGNFFLVGFWWKSTTDLNLKGESGIFVTSLFLEISSAVAKVSSALGIVLG